MTFAQGIFITATEIKLQQWFSAFLMLQHFNKVSHVVMTSNDKILLLLLHTCKFATFVSHNVNLCFLMVLGDPCERVV